MSRTTHENLHVALAQMTSVDDGPTNQAVMLKLIDEALQKNPSTQLISFPENCLYMRLREGEKIAGIELSSELFVPLCKVARERNVHLHLGSIPLREQGQLSNATLLINTKGEILNPYKKIHLFDIHLEGASPIRESDLFGGGERPSLVQIEGWHLGMAICYDLRFSELFSWYAQHSAEVILVPSAFLPATGEAHWEVLLRARAIESQAYVLAAAQAGEHVSATGARRKTYGNSMIVDPWGRIMTRARTNLPEVLTATLNLQEISKVRKQIPMHSHRRLVSMKR